MTESFELPNELWLHVFLELDYFGLKACMSVSTTFKALTSHAALDATLFRSKLIIAAGGKIDLEKVSLHPAFDMISFGCDTKIEQAVFLHYNDKDNTGFMPLTASSAACEHATFPAVSYLELQIQSAKSFYVQNEHGVTVVQVMRALCRFFGTAVAEDLMHGTTLTNRDMMGDHISWTGWDYAVLNDKGDLRLRADWFDS